MNSLFAKKDTIMPLKMFLILTICLLLGRLSVSSFGVYVIGSKSMEPSYPINTLVFAQKSGFETLEVGDVIIYKADALNGKFAFHRVSRITSDGVYTKGDNNSFEDNQLITKDSFVGKEVFSIKLFAKILASLSSPRGLFILIILPSVGVYLFTLALKLLKELKLTQNKKE